MSDGARIAGPARCRTQAMKQRDVQGVDVPLFGGPLDGRDIDVELDDDGYPPQWLPETALWFALVSELLDQRLTGRYELEPVASTGPPRLYAWITTRSVAA
jgi:hypothetical protein